MKTGPNREIFFRYLRPLAVQTALLGLVVLLRICLQLVNPQIMKRFIDMAQADGPIEHLLQVAILFVIVAFAQQITSVASTYLAETVGWKSTNNLRKDLARHTLHLDMGFHNAHTPGEMIERLDGDVMKLANFFSQFVLQVIGNGLLLVGIIVLMLVADIRVGIPMAVLTLVAVLVSLRLQRRGAAYWRKVREAEAGLFGYLEERFSGTEDVRSLGARGYVMRGFFVASRLLVRATVRAGTIGAGLAHNTGHLMTRIGVVITLAVGAGLFLGGDMTLGALYVLYHYAAMIGRPVSALAHELRDLQEAGAGIARVKGLLDRKTTLAASKNPVGILGSDPPGLVFENAWFRYGQDAHGPWVLRDVSFSLPPGRVLGILGRTGSGKTTLARLVYRFYDLQQGALRVGAPGSETEVRTLDLAELRGRIGMVAQNVQLFSSSLRDNLTLFDPDISDAKLEAVLAELGLDRWLAAMKDSLDTEIAPTSLSAGEAQLIAFARVFLRNPGIIILDEASSRLDPATEGLIDGAVQRLLADRTGIIIAHRLQTIRRVDEVLMLSEGRVVEMGRRTDLEDDADSMFSRLLSRGDGEAIAGVLA